MSALDGLSHPPLLGPAVGLARQLDAQCAGSSPAATWLPLGARRYDGQCRPPLSRSIQRCVSSAGAPVKPAGRRF
jgi:hypothetical protein